MKLKFLFIVFILIFSCKRKKDLSNINSEETNIHQLLKEDYTALKSNKDFQLQEKISTQEFILLFFEGIHESISLLEAIKKEKQTDQYQDLIEKTLELQSQKPLKHSLKISNVLYEYSEDITNNAIDGYKLFNFFSGRWFGLWGTDIVQHQWLLPWKLNSLIPNTDNYSISSFQTAWTGDGFGWNYQIQKNGKSYIIGYVCHFNESGKVTMKRPHIGFPQPNNSIIWLTKDHVYIESICENQEYSTNPKHYVISGSYFNDKQQPAVILKTFQEVYFSSFRFGLKNSPASHQ